MVIDDLHAIPLACFHRGSETRLQVKKMIEVLKSGIPIRGVRLVNRKIERDDHGATKESADIFRNVAGDKGSIHSGGKDPGAT